MRLNLDWVVSWDYLILFWPPFLFSLVQYISQPLQIFFHLFPTLSIDHNVICKHYCPWSLFSDLIFQPINHLGKQEGAWVDPWCIPTSTWNPSVNTTTPHYCSCYSYISCTTLTYKSASHTISTFLLLLCCMLLLNLHRDVHIRAAFNDLTSVPWLFYWLWFCFLFFFLSLTVFVCLVFFLMVGW